MDVRKPVSTKEIYAKDEMEKLCAPITRAAAMAFFRNPSAGAG